MTRKHWIILPAFLLILAPFYLWWRPVQAENQVNLYFFYGQGCPHCAEEEIFLGKLKEKYPDLTIRNFEVWRSSDNAKLMGEFGKKLNISVSGVPLTVVGDKYTIGYLDDKTTGEQIEGLVRQAIKSGCWDIGAQILGEEQKTTGEKCEEDQSKIPETVKVPILGEINVKKMSLPALTVVFGLLDGFNPCSMWALIFLVSLLISFGNRKRLLVLGSAFILTSAFSYFLFMSAWLNLFLFLGFIVWVRIIIGLVALGSGYYNLKEYLKNRDAACKVSKNETTRSIIGKLKESANHRNLLIALAGIILLALAVNMVELVCSAGFPAIYTEILSLSSLPAWKYYGYIASYVFFYDLDEIVVLILALLTFKITVASVKYTRWSHLVGGILMLILGLLLIFKHEWLMFG